MAVAPNLVSRKANAPVRPGDAPSSDFAVEASENGKDWTEVHTEEVKLPEKLKAGVLAINTTTKEFSAHLEGLMQSPK
jgi:hypothetical protein